MALPEIEALVMDLLLVLEPFLVASEGQVEGLLFLGPFQLLLLDEVGVP